MTSQRSLLFLAPDHAAQYLPPSEFHQRLRSAEFSVPPGTVLLAFRRRELAGSWTPGAHQWPKSFWETLTGVLYGVRPPLQGWLVRTAPMDTGEARLANLFSKDGFPFAASFALTVQVTDPLRLVVTMGWDRGAILTRNLLDLVAPHGEAVLAGELRGLTAHELAGADLHDRLQQAALTALQSALQPKGVLLTGYARPFRLTCPVQDEKLVIKAEYDALVSRAQAEAEGKRALEELLLSRDAEDVKRSDRRADLQEERARVFQRMQAVILQTAQAEALTRQKLEELRRETDRADVLQDEDWRRFLQELEGAREKDAYQKRAAAEVARLETEYYLKEARLRKEQAFTQASQELLRQQKEAELQWRVREARLEEEAVTARVEAEERRKMLRYLQDQERFAGTERSLKDREAVQEEARRQQEALDAAHRRAQQLEDERARLEAERQRALHDLEIRQRAQALHDSAQDREAERQARALKQLLQTVQDFVGQSPDPRKQATALTLAATIYKEPSLSDLAKMILAEGLGEGKLALLQGKEEAFISWAERHYGALAETFRVNASRITSFQDVEAILDRFLGAPSGTPRSAPQPHPVLAVTDWKVVVSNCRTGILHLHTPDGQGTGFAVSIGGTPAVVTAAHVLGALDKPGAAVQTCVGYWEGRAIPLERLAWRNDCDLAVLRFLDGASVPPLSLGDGQPDQGDRVGILGFPLSGLQPLRQTAPSFSEGTVAGSWVGMFPFPVLHFTAPVNPGNSGGPVLSGQGRVMGVVSAGFNGAEGMSFAIPLGKLREALEGLTSAMAAPAGWRAQPCANGVLLLHPTAGWEVTPPASPQDELRVRDSSARVALRVVGLQAQDGEAALQQGLQRLGLPPQDLDQLEVSEQRYWVEGRGKGAARPLLVALRFDRASGRGLLALAEPTEGAAEDWTARAEQMLRSLYLV